MSNNYELLSVRKDSHTNIYCHINTKQRYPENRGSAGAVSLPCVEPVHLTTLAPFGSRSGENRSHPDFWATRTSPKGDTWLLMNSVLSVRLISVLYCYIKKRKYILKTVDCPSQQCEVWACRVVCVSWNCPHGSSPMFYCSYSFYLDEKTVLCPTTVVIFREVWVCEPQNWVCSGNWLWSSMSSSWSVSDSSESSWLWDGWGDRGLWGGSSEGLLVGLETCSLFTPWGASCGTHRTGPGSVQRLIQSTICP